MNDTTPAPASEAKLREALEKLRSTLLAAQTLHPKAVGYLAKEMLGVIDSALSGTEGRQHEQEPK